ncbi:hypothetical protein OIN59_25220, partial [Acidovorax sp. D2M1]|nr:hypothetical protein [Acidovorax benzenivorans]
QRGKQRTVNARFAAMCSHYLFDPDFCNVASGWEKGVVEKNVQDCPRRSRSGPGRSLAKFCPTHLACCTLILRACLSFF